MSGTIITAIHAPCPLCGFVREFPTPPGLHSAVCGGCNRYIYESEWHAAFMAQIANLTRIPVTRSERAGAR